MITDLLLAELIVNKLLVGILFASMPFLMVLLGYTITKAILNRKK